MMQKTLKGRGRLAALPDLLKARQMKRPLVIAGDHHQASLAELMPEAIFFNGYHANPAWEDAVTAADLFRANGCDGLVSLGGGSAIDTAKAVKALLSASTEAEALQCQWQEVAAVPHFAVPSTAGSGAEATPFAVMYVQGQKHSLSHPSLLPDAVILDSALLDSLPDYARKSAALDALAQGIESYWAKSATDASRVDALLAFTGMVNNLRAYLKGDSHAALAMLQAANDSGRAIAVTRTTAPHALSYGLLPLGYAHGHACMLTLPYLWTLAESDPEAVKKLQSIASALHLGHEMMVPRLLLGMMIDIGMEPKGVPDKETINRLAAGVNPEKLVNHPAPLTEADIRRVYRLALRPVPEPERQACLDIWRYYGI